MAIHVKRDTEREFERANDKIKAIEVVIDAVGLSRACWLVDSKKISELHEDILKAEETTKSPENYSAIPKMKGIVDALERRLKDCYSYR